MYGEVLIHFLLCIGLGSSQATFTKNEINNGDAFSDAVFGILNAADERSGLLRGAVTTRSVDFDATTPDVTGDSEKLVHVLRRNLMRDNYDYQSGSGSGWARPAADAGRAGSVSYSSGGEDTDISSITMRDKPPIRRHFDASVIISDQEPSVAHRAADDAGVKRVTPTDDSLGDAKRFSPTYDSMEDVKRFMPPDDSLEDVKRFMPPDDSLGDIKRFMPPDRDLDGVTRLTPPEPNFKKDLERFASARRQNFNGLKKAPRGLGARSAELVFPPLTPRALTRARSRESWAKMRSIIDREFESRRKALRDNLYYLEDQLQPEYYVSDDRPRDTKYEDYQSDSVNHPQHNNRPLKPQRKQWMSFNDNKKPHTTAPSVVDSSGVRRYRVDKKNRFQAFGDATQASRKRHAINSLLARNGDVQRLTGQRFPWNDGRRRGDLSSFDRSLRKVEPFEGDDIRDLDGIPPKMETNENWDRKDTDWQKRVRKVFGKMAWKTGDTRGDTGKKSSRIIKNKNKQPGKM